MDALREYETANKIIVKLLNRDPTNVDLQRYKSIYHINIGNIYKSQGKLAESLIEYQTSQSIILRLTKYDLDNAVWLRDLSIYHK